MATWPTGLRYDWRDLSETHGSVVDRTEMDRGVPKQRRRASDALVQVQLTVHFDTAAQVAAFTDWFYDDIHAGQDWFDWVHPRTGATLQARVMGGDLGTLTHLGQTLQWARRTLQLEYVRSAW